MHAISYIPAVTLYLKANEGIKSYVKIQTSYVQGLFQDFPQDGANSYGQISRGANIHNV